MALGNSYICICIVVILNGAVLDAAITRDTTTSLDYNEVPIVERALYTPPLEEIADVLSNGLLATFESVSVTAEESPDLSQSPFNLTSPGLTGNAKLLDIGGIVNLLPELQTDKLYDVAALARYLGRENAFIIGCGAGPWPYVGTNSEGIINLSLRDGNVIQGSRAASVQPIGASKDDDSLLLEELPPTETRVASLGYFLLSDGRPGKVIKVVVKKRIGSLDFVTAIRQTLAEYYGDNVVGLGGTFLLKEGIVNHHVMPQHGTTPVCNDADLDEWLHYFDLTAPITHIGTLVTGTLNLNLTLQHFHGFSSHGEGGHYHYDITPDTVEYEGYFMPASSIIRVDRPTQVQCG